MRAPKKGSDGIRWDWPDREWLEYQYGTLDKAPSLIAAEIGAWTCTVRNWMRESGVTETSPTGCPLKKRNASGKVLWVHPSREWLYDQHVTQKKSLNEISGAQGVGWYSLEEWFREAGIEVRNSRLGENSPGWKGGRSRGYGKRTLRRAGVPEKCAWCGQGWEGAYSLHLHHKNHRKRDNAQENLMWLCQSCNLLEARLWHMLKKDKIDLKCENRTMVIRFK